MVRGVDRKGRALHIRPAYIAHGLREQAQELATYELGPRSELTVRRQKEVGQPRLTSSDRELAPFPRLFRGVRYHCLPA